MWVGARIGTTVMLDRTGPETCQNDPFCRVEEISEDIFTRVTLAGPDVQADVSVLDGQTSNFSMLSEFLVAAGSAIQAFSRGAPSEEQERPEYVVLLGDKDQPRYVLAPASSQLGTAPKISHSKDKDACQRKEWQRFPRNNYPHLPVGVKPLESLANTESEEETMARIRAIIIDQRPEQSTMDLTAPEGTQKEPKKTSASYAFPDLNQPEEEQTIVRPMAPARQSAWTILSLAVLPALLVMFSDHEALLLLIISSFTTFAAGRYFYFVAKPMAANSRF